MSLCPHCGQTVRNVKTEHVTGAFGQFYGGEIHSCPNCNKVLGVEGDRNRLIEEIAAAMVARLQRTRP